MSDDGFVLSESRAIMIYLFDKYSAGKFDSLYPVDAQQRALVNQRVFFDMGTFYNRLADYYYTQAFDKKPADPDKFRKIGQAFELLDVFLSGQAYAAGETVTLADYALALSMHSYELVGYDYAKHANVVRWYGQCKAIDGWEAVVENMSGYTHFFDDIL